MRSTGLDVLDRAARLRERYAAKMTDGPERRAFDVVTSTIGSKSAELNEIASKIGSLDTLDRFLRDLRAGFSDLATSPPVPAESPVSADGPS